MEPVQVDGLQQMVVNQSAGLDVNRRLFPSRRADAPLLVYVPVVGA